MAEEKRKLTEDPMVLKALLATTEKAYLTGHEFAVKTQEHSDRMLTWAIGLMGGGLYGAHALLRCSSPHVWAWALLPWLLGILCALAGRVVLARIMAAGALGSHARVSRVQLLMIETDGPLISRNLQELFDNSNLSPEEKTGVRLRPWGLGAYYATHVLFGIGIVAVAVFVIRQSLHGARS